MIPRISYFDFTGGACDFYRIVQPMSIIKEQGYADSKCIKKGDGSDTIDEAANADMFYFGRPADDKLLNLIKHFKERDRFIAIDFDDDFFNISPWSPHYADSGLDELKVTTTDGKEIEVWKDGVNIDLKKNHEKARVIAECVAEVDLVTVTTPELAQIYAPKAKMVAIVPNSIDFRVWNPVKIERQKQEIRMGWAGGTSHLEDWAMMEYILPEVMAAEPRLKLVIAGTNFKQITKHLPQDRVEFHKWVQLPAYPYKMQLLDLDFAIIPLKDTPFNRCKSSIKWVEMASLKVPSVASYVTPYKEMMRGDNGIFVENNPQAWKEGILKMASDPIQRILMGVNARAFVEEEFNAERNSVLWLEAFKKAQEGSREILCQTK